MAKLTRIEVNCATGEQEVIELTTAEIAELDQMRAQTEQLEAQKEAELQAKAEAKASAEAKLAAFGLTSEEIAAL